MNNVGNMCIDGRNSRGEIFVCGCGGGGGYGDGV